MAGVPAAKHGQALIRPTALILNRLYWVQKFAPLLARAGRRAADRPFSGGFTGFAYGEPAPGTVTTGFYSVAASKHSILPVIAERLH